MIIVTDACAGKLAKTNIVRKCLCIDNTTGTASKQPYATVVIAVKKKARKVLNVENCFYLCEHIVNSFSVLNSGLLENDKFDAVDKGRILPIEFYYYRSRK